ncbi:MAG: hypothetical protein KatS3mg051_0418 [Anaerolineae bacterium]|nr:MAG: hypothetical protein KatS3mg051_0418 [Anaerolineae bacterium]
MQLPRDYYHCFLGNGLDAVLIGPTGSMVPDKIVVDRCNWYKSNRYYPEDRLVQVAGRWPLDKPLEHAEGSGWYEVAPLGRTWYHISFEGQQLALQASSQHFVPQEGTLYTTLDYGPVKGEAVTWLHASRSLLVEQYIFDHEVEFQAWMGPGVWLQEGWDTDPFRSVIMDPDAPQGHYDLGETQGILAMRLEAAPVRFGSAGLERMLSARGRRFTKYFAIWDNLQGPLDAAELDRQIAPGYQALRAEHLAFWRAYFGASRVQIPDSQFQYFYDASMYHLKAMQSRESGGLPVNNLRRTWSSHIFWDSYFLQRALLEANHRHEALEGCRFFQRTIDHARRHAQEDFGCQGLKWDWEITHDGRKAYGALVHQKFQIHNNASYANQIWGYYEHTLDEAMLREFFPILEGLAQFYLTCIVQDTGDALEIGYQVGVHESPIKVRNDGTNLAGTIAILRHAVRAAHLLGLDSPLIRRCAEAIPRLMKTMDGLYNGRYFMASNDSDALNMSSIAPIYPMRIIDSLDSRAISTVQAFLERYRGRIVGHGGNESGFPWAAGVLATICALQGQGDLAWQVIESTRPTICIFGGMTEVMQDNEWNMQYFGTAQAAVCTALHHLLLQSEGNEVRLFPALPTAWEHAGFENLLAAGLNVTATWQADTGVACTVKNVTAVRLNRRIRFGAHCADVTLEPGEERQIW